MASEAEFVVRAFSKVAETNRTEEIIGDHTVIIQGTKRSFLSKEEIFISIHPSTSDSKNKTFITANVNDISHSIEIKIETFYDLLNRTKVINSNLKNKLTLLFNKANKSVSDLAKAKLLVAAYQKHLDHSWPEISDYVKIEVADGSGGSEINFIQNLGWEDDNWKSFLYNGILLKAALDNCQKLGVEKFTIVCNGEYVEYTIQELRQKGY